jgi:hypothetical protein
MTYVEKIMDEIAEAHPKLDRELLKNYAQLALTTGPATTAENVHDAWVLWKLDIRPDHWYIVPFSQLTPEVQAMDEEYAVTIRRVAEALDLGKR